MLTTTAGGADGAVGARKSEDGAAGTALTFRTGAGGGATLAAGAWGAAGAGGARATIARPINRPLGRLIGVSMDRLAPITDLKWVFRMNQGDAATESAFNKVIRSAP